VDNPPPFLKCPLKSPKTPANPHFPVNNYFRNILTLAEYNGAVRIKKKNLMALKTKIILVLIVALAVLGALGVIWFIRGLFVGSAVVALGYLVRR
jgi:hypothetical protein